MTQQEEDLEAFLAYHRYRSFRRVGQVVHVSHEAARQRYLRALKALFESLPDSAPLRRTFEDYADLDTLPAPCHDFSAENDEQAVNAV